MAYTTIVDIHRKILGLKLSSMASIPIDADNYANTIGLTLYFYLSQ